MEIIRKKLTLEYWPVNNWFEGRFREVPDVLSQGKDLEELEQNTREDCADRVNDPELAKSQGYGHLDASDIMDATVERKRLDRLQAAIAQLQVLSAERREKVFGYIEDLVDLEALERRVDEEDASRAEAGDEEEW